MWCLAKLSFEDLGRSWSITTEPPNSDLAEWKLSKSWIFQHFLKRVLDVRFYFPRWLLESSSRARHSWSISKHFLGLTNVPYGVAAAVRIRNLEFFWIFPNVAPTPLEGPLLVLADWKVICNASVGCLGVPGDDSGWYETTSLWPPNHPTPKPNFYFSLR